MIPNRPLLLVLSGLQILFFRKTLSFFSEIFFFISKINFVTLKPINHVNNKIWMNEFSSKWIFHPFELGSKSTAMVELTAQPIYPFRQFCNRKCKLQRLYTGLCNYILSSVCREVHVWLPKGQEKGHFLFNANSFHGQNEVFFRSTVSWFFFKNWERNYLMKSDKFNKCKLQ